MKRTLALGLLMIGLSTSTQAEGQESTRPLTLAEYTAGSPQYIYPETLRGLQWLGKDYIYTRGTELIAGNSHSERTLLTVNDLQRIIPDSATVSKLSAFPRISVVEADKSLLLIRIGDVEYFIDTESSSIRLSRSIVPKTQATEYNPRLSHVAVVIDNNIQIQSLQTREAHYTVTTDGSPSLVYGQSVHQNEFGIHKGLFWSPNGKKLAFYRMDQSMVTPYPILHVDARRPYSEAQYYPMAGTPSHQVTIGIYDLGSRQTIYLKTGLPAEKYLTNITWTPDSREIFVAEVNREQTQCDLIAYSPETGKPLRTLLSETSPVYVEPMRPALFVPGAPDQFVWQSRRDGWKHLYLYDMKGHMVRQLTQGKWEVTDVQGFSPDGRTLFYQSTAVSPLERHLYGVNIRTGRSRRLTPEAGWHTTRISPDGLYVLDTYESMQVAREIHLSSTTTGRRLRTLLQADNPDARYQTPDIQLGELTAADGKTVLHYRLIRPHDFDPKRQYPAIIYVYNGPHAQLVQNKHRGAARGWELHMANSGYIILTVDGRGSEARGAAFEQVIHRQLGHHEMADQMQGVTLLRQLGYVDMERIGVYGWSYGGFMATNLMLTHPDVFKVGVAGGPVMDWARYEIMYGERYMDSPERNPDGYRASNLVERAGDLRGRLLLIHGTVDPVVIWQHSLLFMQAAIAAGTHPDYMVYPEHPHNVIGPDRVHLNQVITRYFQDHL